MENTIKTKDNAGVHTEIKRVSTWIRIADIREASGLVGLFDKGDFRIFSVTNEKITCMRSLITFTDISFRITFRGTELYKFEGTEQCTK